MPSEPRAATLADPVFFRDTGRVQAIFFGTMPAGELTHRVVFDAEKKRAHCSCPFFPKPCLHARALEQLTRQTGLFPEQAALPAWAQALTDRRPADARIRLSNADQRARDTQKRRFERLERAARGFDDLEAWLLDLLRRGLATAVSEDPRFAEGIAARAADASMTSISRRLRLLAELPANDPDWAERTLETLADCYLAVRAFRRRAELPEALLHDLQTFLGMAIRKDEVLTAGERLHDTWAVLGRREEPVENQLSVRRTWLLGARTGRYALLLDHAFGSAAGFPPGFAAGESVAGTLVFYPSAFPQRALAAGDLHTLPKKMENWPGFPDVETFAAAYAASLGARPWLDFFPAAFPAVTPVIQAGRVLLVDAAGRGLPLAGLDSDGWKLLALGGGRPVGVFGEWDGAALRVLNVAAEGRIVVV